MTDDHQSLDSQSTTTPIEELRNLRVAIVDDAFDTLEQRGLSLREKEDLWRYIEFDTDVRKEIAELNETVHSANDLSEELVSTLLASRLTYPAFATRWDASEAGLRMMQARRPVESLEKYLRDVLNMNVRSFGSDVAVGILTEYRPDFVFLDWYLGDDIEMSLHGSISASDDSQAVAAAVAKVKDLMEEWPDSLPKPLVILMSSKPHVREYAKEFCHRSSILRGMFYAIPKSVLTDIFYLRMHMHLFSMSLAPGRQLQEFMDTMRGEYIRTRDRLLQDISDLSLTDYAYIQRLSLQRDGQPLGDYLLWLFSAYMGHLLFGEALKTVRANLDGMTFGAALPSLEPPSDMLTEIYHTALFDMSVGPVSAHPLAGDTSISTGQEIPALALGDLFVREAQDPKRGGVSDEHGISTEAPGLTGVGAEADLFLLITAQCDLEFRPDSQNRARKASESLVLIPGSLTSVGDSTQHESRPKTELFRWDGRNYRIEWDTKRIQVISQGGFEEWRRKERIQRIARLRLPFALEVQRAFASDLTRVGAPVVPPIYQAVTARLLLGDKDRKSFVAEEVMAEGEDVFLVLTTEGQQCVLTMPLLRRIRTLLNARLEELRVEVGTNGEANIHLSNRIASLERAIEDDDQWEKLRAPLGFDAKNLFGGHVQVLSSVNVGDACGEKVVVAISLDIDKV